MEATSLFFVTFALVFIGELGDKSQAIAFIAALTNHTKRLVVFSATALALIMVSGVTIYATGLIPSKWLPLIVTASGIGLIGYGIYIVRSLGLSSEAEGSVAQLDISHYKLFIQQFSLVAISELGDKTQVASFGIAVANPHEHIIVFAGAATALTAVAGITILAARFVPHHWHTRVQIAGAMLLILFGTYILIA